MAYYKHLNGLPLKSYYTIEIEVKGGSNFVTFHSKIHEDKSLKCPVSYSLDFTDSEILNDHNLIGWVKGRYGDVWVRSY